MTLACCEGCHTEQAWRDNALVVRLAFSRLCLCWALGTVQGVVCEDIFQPSPMSRVRAYGFEPKKSARRGVEAQLRHSQSPDKLLEYALGGAMRISVR